MKRWLPTLAVLAILAGLGVWVLRNETKPLDAGPAKDHLWQLKPEDLRRVELADRTTGLTLALAREGGTWWIDGPRRLECDGDAMDLLTRQLADPDVERKLPLPPNLAPYGLDVPRFRATATLTSGAKRTLLVGVKNPTDSAYFVLEENGKTLYTVSSYSVEGFMKTLGDLRSKQLLAFDPAAVTRLVLRRPKGGGTIEFARQGPEAWAITAPLKAAADRYALDGLLSDLKGLKGTEVIEEPHAFSRLRLDQPDAEVVVDTGSGTGQTLTLAKPNRKKDDAYASSTRLPFALKLAGSFVLTSVLKPVVEFRDRLLLSASREDLTECEITDGALKILCRKSPDGKWTVAEPAGAGAAADTELSDLLFEVVYVRAEDFVADKPSGYAAYGLAPPRFGVRVTGVKDKVPFTARYALGNRFGEKAYLKFADQPNVYGVRKDLLEKVERFAAKVRAAGKPAAAPSTAAPAKPTPASKPAPAPAKKP